MVSAETDQIRTDGMDRTILLVYKQSSFSGSDDMQRINVWFRRAEGLKSIRKGEKNCEC